MWRWIRKHRLSSVRAVFVSNKNPRSSCMTAYSPLSTIWLWFILLFQDVRHKLIQIRFTAIIIPLSLNSGNKIGSWLVHLKQFIKLNKQTNHLILQPERSPSQNWLPGFHIQLRSSGLLAVISAHRPRCVQKGGVHRCRVFWCREGRAVGLRWVYVFFVLHFIDNENIDFNMKWYKL